MSSDFKDLKVWCQWKRKWEGDVEESMLLVKEIEDAISQAGMMKTMKDNLIKKDEENRALLLRLHELTKEKI